MNRSVFVGLGAFIGLGALCLSSAALVAAQKRPELPRTEFVEIDAAVDDADGRPVPGLRDADFRIKEDGRPVAITRFAEISAAGISGQADGRSVVLLLDDTSLSPTWTQTVQSIARLFVDRMRPADSLSVMRLRHREDEPFGDQKEALSRIASYRSGSYPLLDDTHETWLKTLAKLSRGLPHSQRRTVVVGIGSPGLFDIYLPVPEYTLLWPYWLDALSASAEAGVALYVVDPIGVTRSRFDLGFGLVDETGGAVFMRSNNFARAVDAIWREAGHYYRLGYVPTARQRELHTIEVTATHPGLTVGHAEAGAIDRRTEGDALRVEP